MLSFVWFSFLISNIFISSSFWKQDVAENDELSENVWEQELEEHLAAKPFQQDQLQQNLSKEENKNSKLDHNKSLEYKRHKAQLRAKSVPDSELRQLHLQHLHEQDQPFTGTKHLPKEQCFTSCLLRQMISSVSKKELERLHLTRSSLEQDEYKKQLEQLLSEQLCAEHLAERNLLQVQLVYSKFLAANFGHQISEKQLQQNLSTDQPQLPDSNLAQTNFQQLSLEQHIYKEKILNNELATNLENKQSSKKTFLFGTSSLTTWASRRTSQLQES